MLSVYEDDLTGPVPKFPREIEKGIDTYLAMQVALHAADEPSPTPAEGSRSR